MIAWTIWYKAVGHDPWHPLEPYRSLPVGHYYLAARFPQQDQYLEWRWKYFAPDGSHQTYHFHGQTNPEGLISLLDLETVQSGTWQLSLRPDVFAELCGETWRVKHQFQIIPRPALMIPPSTSVATTETNQIVPYLPQPVAATTPLIPLVEAPSAYSSLEQPVEEAGTSPPCESSAAINPDPLPSGDEPTNTNGGDDSHPTPPQPLENHHQNEVDLSPVETPVSVQLDSSIPTDSDSADKRLTNLTDESLVSGSETPAETRLARPFPDFAPASSQQEFLSEELDNSHLHPVHYSLELVYPEANYSPLHVDITVMTDDRYPPIKLDLPNLNRSHKRLWSTFPKRRSPLPPKLT